MICFAPPSAWKDDRVLLDPEESHHLLTVRRRKTGDRVQVIDGEGRIADVEVAASTPGCASLRVLEERIEPRPRPGLQLVQSLPKARKMDLIIQKAAELGAEEVVPVTTAHSEVRLDGKQAAKRVERWNAIALNAAKQCGRPHRLRVAPVATLDAWMHTVEPDTRRWVCSLGPDGLPLRVAIDALSGAIPGKLSVLVGPEGDFSTEEVRALAAAGVQPVSLGNHVLRSETAALFALSVLSYAWHG